MVSFIDTLQSIGGDTHETKNVCGSYLKLGLSLFTPDYMSQGREVNEHQERETL